MDELDGVRPAYPFRTVTATPRRCVSIPSPIRLYSTPREIIEGEQGFCATFPSDPIPYSSPGAALSIPKQVIQNNEDNNCGAGVNMQSLAVLLAADDNGTDVERKDTRHAWNFGRGNLSTLSGMTCC